MWKCSVYVGPDEIFVGRYVGDIRVLLIVKWQNDSRPQEAKLLYMHCLGLYLVQARENYRPCEMAGIYVIWIIEKLSNKLITTASYNQDQNNDWLKVFAHANYFGMGMIVCLNCFFSDIDVTNEKKSI